jgi:transposase
MILFWLWDEAWSAIKPHLPKNQSGARRVGDLRVIFGYPARAESGLLPVRPPMALPRLSTILS